MQKQTKPLNYDGVVEGWKVELIHRRAVRMGFNDADLDDVQQAIILKVADFVFDPALGATEKTALVALIDNQLKKIIRTESRYQSCLKRFSDKAPLADSTLPSTLQFDLWEVVRMLGPEEQQVCFLMSQGHTRSEVARRLGYGPKRLNRLIRHIREQFGQMGIDEAGSWTRER